MLCPNPSPVFALCCRLSFLCLFSFQCTLPVGYQHICFTHYLRGSCTYLLIIGEAQLMNQYGVLDFRCEFHTRMWNLSEKVEGSTDYLEEVEGQI